MATCPKCKGEVPYLKLMKHTRWTPVVCPHCDSRLHFDKPDWFKKAGTFVLLLLLLCAICLIGTWARPSLAWAAAMAVASLILLVKFLFDVKELKLREKETEAQPGSTLDN